MKYGKIALIQTPFWTVQTPPFAVAVLTSFLRKQKHTVFPFDINIEFYRSTNRVYYLFWELISRIFYVTNNNLIYKLSYFLNKKFFDKWIDKIIQIDAKVIGFTIYQTNVLFSSIMAEKLKKVNDNLKIIFGGPDCGREKNCFKYINNNYVDFVVVGEGEYTLNEILSNPKKKSYKGALKKSETKIIDGGNRQLIKNLNKLPFPNFDDFDLRKYTKFLLPIEFSRGCIGKCSFCGENFFWKCFRSKSAEKLFSEILYLKKKYKVFDFLFVDSLINGNLKELEKFCHLIIKNKLEIRYGGYAKIRPDMKLELLEKMKNSGCFYLAYGVESGSQKVLDDMKKGYKIADAERLLRLTKKSNIITITIWVIGFPNESFIDFIETLKFVFKNRQNIDIVNLGILTLTKGSDVFNHYKKYAIISNKSRIFWKSKNSNFLKRVTRQILFGLFTNLIRVKTYNRL